MFKLKNEELKNNKRTIVKRNENERKNEIRIGDKKAGGKAFPILEFEINPIRFVLRI